MINLFYIIWNANPEIISGLPPRWYGLLFALGFLIGSYIMRWIYKLDGRDPEEVERLTLYMVIATIVGARLGHCLFYDPIYYLSNPIKIACEDFKEILFFFLRFLFVVKFSFSSIDSSKLGFISSTLIKGEVVIFSSAFKTLIEIKSKIKNK